MPPDGISPARAVDASETAITIEIKSRLTVFLLLILRDARFLTSERIEQFQDFVARW